MITDTIKYQSALSKYILAFVPFIWVELKQVHAMEWRKTAEIPIAVEYNDNLFYSNTDKISDIIYHVGTLLRLDGTDEENEFNLSGGVDIQRLQTTSKADNEFYSARARYEHLTEATISRVIASYDERSTRTSELQSIGLVNIFGKLKTYTIMPTLELELNELNRLVVNADFSRFDYDIETFIDYKNYQGQIIWSRIISEESEGGIEILLQRYDAVQNNIDYDYGALSGQLAVEEDSDFSYETAFGLGYILRKTGSNYKTLLFRLSALKEFTYTRVSGAFSSNLQPTSAGQITRLTSLDFNLIHLLNENDNISLALRASRSEIVSTTVPYTTDYIRGEIGYLHQRADWLTFDVSYSYTSSISNIVDSRRFANIVFARLTLLFES